LARYETYPRYQCTKFEIDFKGIDMEKLKIIQGSTLSQPVRYGIEPLVYKPITAVVNLAPLRLTVPTHEMPPTWRTELLSLKGLVELNSTETGKDSDYHVATVIGPDTVEFNEINAAKYGAYTANSGYLRYYTPAVLTGKKAFLYIWNKINGTLLLTLSSDNGDIDIDDVNFEMTINMSAQDTGALTWKKGVYVLKLEETLTGVVEEVVSGPVEVEIE
jgi:hypothetical protein